MGFVMKKILSAILFPMIVLCFSQTAYGGNLYAGGNAGLAVLADSAVKVDGIPVEGEFEFDMGPAIGGFIGYDFGKIRLEGEVSYQKNDFDKLTMIAYGQGFEEKIKGDMSLTALLVNGYYDLPPSASGVANIYITGGAGIVNVRTHDFSAPSWSAYTSGSDDDTVFAFQVGIGVAVTAYKAVIMDFQYRYFGATYAEIEGGDFEIGSHNILVRLRFPF